VDRLTATISAAGTELPAALVRTVAAALEQHPSACDRARVDAVRAVAPVNAREHALAVCDAWQESCPELPGAAVALALRAAAKAASGVRDAQRVELVWTGPATTVAVRATRQALVDLAREARRTLLLVSFSAYRDQGILDELSAAAARHVEIIFVLETTADSRGGLDRDAQRAFDELRPGASFYVWPAEKRPANGGLLHAKTVVADRSAALISSANLSGAAMERNMELGVLVTGEPLPRLVEQHFRSLIAEGVLVPVVNA
jgi:phosphatidylserine/phosphatidylglycerophosphate/cardiolipin synthase-like enzyme